MSIRFVHGADFHLDSPFTGIQETQPLVAETLRRATFEAYELLIQLCIDRGVDALLYHRIRADQSRPILSIRQTRLLKTWRVHSCPIG